MNSEWPSSVSLPDDVSATKVISFEAAKEKRARAAVLVCGDGCTWPLPNQAVYGLPDGIKIAIEVTCPLCGAKHFSDVA